MDEEGRIGVWGACVLWALFGLVVVMGFFAPDDRDREREDSF